MQDLQLHGSKAVPGQRNQAEEEQSAEVKSLSVIHCVVLSKELLISSFGSLVVKKGRRAL